MSQACVAELNKIIAVISFIVLITLGVSGQASSKKYWEEKAYWKEIVKDSKLIIVGTVEEDYHVGRPEKFKLTPDNPNPSQTDLYVGRVFRVKVTGILKSEKKVEKNIENKYVNVFLYWIGGVPSLSEPIILKGMEYVLFLKPNDDKELEGKGTIQFNKLNYEIITKPFDYKSSYLVVPHGRRGVVVLKNNKDKLIKVIKRAI
ncbi:MAG: hypothetical protein LC768_00270 [Acidobacteria bacterium]|nr:hypothetical protein [Acidobacteriota bacterium]MCA1636772.1 hypothetical protein [Acidobacteriota bacterium]